MSLFDTIIVQPIFNLLLFIYGVIPGSDFGIAIIIFTIIVRVAMWPLVKKQLHQTKIMRTLQPELKKVKAKAKGNKQLEGQMMMELYREKGVSPFGSIGLLIVQLPVFIALFQVIRILTQHHDRIPEFTYGFMTHLPAVGAIIDDSAHNFNETLLHLVNLTQPAISNGSIYWPVMILAIIAAGFQFIQSKQLMPNPKDGMKIRDVFKAQASGNSVDQAEVSAAMTSKLVYIFPFITFFVAINFPGGLVLYYGAQSLVAIFQQRSVLREDSEEMEAIASEPDKKKKVKAKVAKTPKAPEASKASPKKSSNVGASGLTKVRTFVEGSPEERAELAKFVKKKSTKSSKKSKRKRR